MIDTMDPINLRRRRKLSHVGTVMWQTKTLKRKTDALVHVGSGDFWLGIRFSLIMLIFR
jgi:hypothetical protein